MGCDMSIEVKSAVPVKKVNGEYKKIGGRETIKVLSEDGVTDNVVLIVRGVKFTVNAYDMKNAIDNGINT